LAVGVVDNTTISQSSVSSLIAPRGASLPAPPSTGSVTSSTVVLDDFGWAQGWGGAGMPRIITDVNGDGTSDYLGFGYSATFIAYGGRFSDGQGSSGPGNSRAVVVVAASGTSARY